MPYVNDGTHYQFPFKEVAALAAGEKLDKEQSRKLANELIILRNGYERESYNNTTLKAEVKKLEIENAFMLRLIEKWGIGE